MKVLAVVGRSGAGKTTLLEALVAELTGRGRRVATLKHTHHLLQDRPSSDSQRHRQAGANLALLSGPGGFCQWGPEPDPEWLVELALSQGCDLVLVEGLKRGPFPRLEVVRAQLHPQPMLPLEELWGVASDLPFAARRWFPLDDPRSLADALLDGDGSR